jgi:hypothetical protein
MPSTRQFDYKKRKLFRGEGHEPTTLLPGSRLSGLCRLRSDMRFGSAQGGGKSLPELSAQAQKIKVGETTEAEVISLLGEPSKTSEGIKGHAGAQDLKHVKRLIYGPEKNIVVIIDSSTNKVLNVKIKPAQ